MDRTIQEVQALLGYLVKHNRDHAQELKELAERMQALGSAEAYEHMQRGLELLDGSNERLEQALEAVEAQDVPR